MKEEYPTEVKQKYENVVTKTVGSPDVRCHCKKILLRKINVLRQQSFHTEESTKSKPWMTRSSDQIDGKETNKLTHEFKTLDKELKQ